MCVVTVRAPQGTLRGMAFTKPPVLRKRNTQHKGLCSQRQQDWQWPRGARSREHSGKSPSIGLACPIWRTGTKLICVSQVPRGSGYHLRRGTGWKLRDNYSGCLGPRGSWTTRDEWLCYRPQEGQGNSYLRVSGWKSKDKWRSRTCSSPCETGDNGKRNEFWFAAQHPRFYLLL